jgi:hypothetical protein
MTNRSDPRKTWVYPIVIFLLVLSVACIFNTASGGGTAPVGGVITPGGTADKGAIPATYFQFGTGTFNLSDPTAGLAGLTSYDSILTISFDGQVNGQAQKWTSASEMIVSQQDPTFRQLTVHATGQTPPNAYFAEANGVQISQSGIAACQAIIPADGQSSADSWEPARQLATLHGAVEAGSDTLDGVPVKHYTFDAHAMGDGDLVTATGEVWIATEAGYIMKYTVNYQGGPKYFGTGTTGTMTWNYQLKDINQAVSLSLPSGCASVGKVDAPRMPDATLVVEDPGLTVYTTSSNLVDVLAFYQQKLPAAGWTDDHVSSKSPKMGMALYSKGDLQLILTVNTTDTPASVWLLMSHKVSAGQ